MGGWTSPSRGRCTDATLLSLSLSLPMLSRGPQPCGWGHLATQPAVTQPWRAAHSLGPCGDKATPPRPTCGPPSSPLSFSTLRTGREVLTVARQAGPAAAAVGSRSPAAPAPPPRAESPRPTGRRPAAPLSLRLRVPLHPMLRAREAPGTRKGHPFQLCCHSR